MQRLREFWQREPFAGFVVGGVLSLIVLAVLYALVGFGVLPQ